MKKPLISLSLIALIFAVPFQNAFAKKKYRYIKREHGLKLNWNFPGQIWQQGGVGGFTFTGDISAGYTYNWKGFLEVGPYLTLGFPFDLSAGLLVEWNIIKNRGRRKFIPAVGLKLGGDSVTTYERAGHYGLPLSLKYFVAKRTPLIVTLEPYIHAPNFTGFNPLTVNYNFTGGFAYYFDVY